MSKTLVLSIIAGWTVCAMARPGGDTVEYARERRDMVQYQIQARGVHDKRVLAAMRKVPRHLFVPPEFRDQAYADHPLPIGHGQTISQPYIVALMTELLALEGDEKVLEIGTGSGYQAAVLAELAATVYTIEIIGDLAQRAQRVLGDLGYDNIHFRVGDGYKGWPEAAPFDAIIVTAAPPKIPQALLDQLRSPGGRMVVPVGTWDQNLILIEATPEGLKQTAVAPVRFVPMRHGGKNGEGPP